LPERTLSTIEEERVRVFHLAEKVGVALSGLVLFVGSLLVYVSLQYLFSVPGFFDVKVLLAPKLVAAALGLVGLVNLVCGLVLLAKK